MINPAHISLIEPQLVQLLDGCHNTISTKKPSEWYEENMVHPEGTAFPGKHSYRRNPYLREVIDCFGKDHPARVISFMKGAQIGVTSSVLVPAVGYFISQSPGNILFMTGHADHTLKAIENIDRMIDQCGIRHLIRPTITRSRQSRTGDTNTTKDFPGGKLVSGAMSNHKLLHQYDVPYFIGDDADNAKRASKDAGDTVDLANQRTAGYAYKRKMAWVSTPKLKHESIIEPMFLSGDRRYWNVPCPCCGEFIVWQWEIDLDGNDKAGIYYKVDSQNRVIQDSVGYVCQSCGEFFDDRDKEELMNLGKWVPTATPTTPDHWSFHISALYAPVGMFDWAHYAQQYVNANPDGEPDRGKMQTFTNVVLGLTWEDETVELNATKLQLNQRDYQPGTLPESMSLADGNDRIVMVTLAADLNGVEDDARLDYEIVAWTESGSTYSVSHGSIGTFIPREGENKADREHWTYRHGTERSVWPVLEEVLNTTYKVDKFTLPIICGAIDVGYMKDYAWSFIDNSNHLLFGVKGDVTNKHTPFQRDAKLLKPGRLRPNLWIVESNLLKDDLAALMDMKWNSRQDEHQPEGFMNFPQSADGMYQYTNFFSHFEAEKRQVARNAQHEPTGFRWEKKTSAHQNHLFDCRLYNMAARQIFQDKVCKEAKVDSEWSNVVKMIIGE